jgi:uncharacterized protein (DUF1330 family)
MTTDSSQPITLVFLGHTSATLADRAAAYEDAVLALLADHGARVVYRGRRLDDQDPTLPFEVHVLWFPNRAAFDAYLADERRAALLRQFGEVFTSKTVVEVATISTEPLPR